MSKRGAVFLSYASQDAEAARLLCEALRAAGIEVWFDLNELRGGDAWDAKIRRQIAECALFVPLISVHTEARREGYFRIEWRLAAQRTHAMSDDTAFLLPVVTDDTGDTDARVPAEFKAVQWTRLGAAGATEGFCRRVAELLQEAAGDPARKVPGSRKEARDPAQTRPGVRSPRRRRLLAGLVVAFALAAAAVLVWRPWRHAEPSPPGAPRPAIRAAPAESPASPARDLVKKARTLYEPWDLATAEDFAQAETLLLRALELDPGNVEAIACQAILSCGMFVMPHDSSAERLREAQTRAELAVKLAPKSDEALFAHAYALRLSRDTASEGIRLLRELVARNPSNKMMLRTLGAPLSRQPETAQEGLDLLARAAALPGGDPIADYVRGETLARLTTRYAEALAAFDRAILQAPAYTEAHKEKIKTLLERLGDVEGARSALAQVPNLLLRQDRIRVMGFRVAMARNAPDEAVRFLSQASPYLTMDIFSGPSAYLRGLAHRRAGRRPAAEIEWRAALQEMQRRLAARASNPMGLRWKALLHALLGERADALAAFELYQQFAAAQQVDLSTSLPHILIRALLGTPEEAITFLQTQLVDPSEATRQMASAAVLFDPALDPFREHPAFSALVETAQAEFAARRRLAAER
ncbi:MAG: toll/interleukin-1 receptor domain-containing protein [Verrucomicrobia bacterium]|nr:toll/interleukin-1 receptor domain-containing protein [Verrucomicrobiota bacterium]